MYLRIFDTEFEVSPGATVAFNPASPVTMNDGVLQLRIAVLGVMDKGKRVLTPHIRRVMLNGAERPIPAEFAKGGARSLATIGPTPEAATDNICEAFLEAKAWL